MSATSWGWLVLLFPLAGMLVIAFTSQVLPQRVHGAIGTLAIALSFAAAVGVFAKLQAAPEDGRQVVAVAWDYARAGGIDAPSLKRGNEPPSHTESPSATWRNVGRIPMRTSALFVTKTLPPPVSMRSCSVSPCSVTGAAKNRSATYRVGMTICIEPMVNQGKFAVETLADKWTLVTKDGKLSAHFEHTVAVTRDGPEILTAE